MLLSSSPRRRTLSLALLLAPSAALPAQEVPDAVAGAGPETVEVEVDSPWSGSLQANGSAFFGNSDQRVFGGRGTLARSDSVVQLEARGEVVYGDAEIGTTDRQVVKRSLLGTITADYRPKGMLSPFITVTVETNLEKKIDTRYSIGVGAKRTFVRNATTESSLSVGLTDELTVPMALPATEPAASTRLTRWSVRGRLQHAFDPRLRLSHLTFYQPSARMASRYLVRSTSEAEYALTQVVGITTSMQVNYDSEATIRGARVNHDGQVLFGVTARW